LRSLGTILDAEAILGHTAQTSYPLAGPTCSGSCAYGSLACIHILYLNQIDGNVIALLVHCRHSLGLLCSLSGTRISIRQILRELRSPTQSSNLVHLSALFPLCLLHLLGRLAHLLHHLPLSKLRRCELLSLACARPAAL